VMPAVTTDVVSVLVSNLKRASARSSVSVTGAI
jgi:hypothetical protein